MSFPFLKNMALCGWASIVGFDGVVDWWGIVARLFDQSFECSICN